MQIKTKMKHQKRNKIGKMSKIHKMINGSLRKTTNKIQLNKSKSKKGKK